MIKIGPLFGIPEGMVRLCAMTCFVVLEFSRENEPQEVFVVGVGEKTASLIATLQTVSPTMPSISP